MLCCQQLKALQNSVTGLFEAGKCGFEEPAYIFRNRVYSSEPSVNPGSRTISPPFVAES